MGRSMRVKVVLMAAFAALGSFLAENAYPQVQQGSWQCSKSAECKDFNGKCGTNGKCTTKDQTSAVGCVGGTKPCATTDTGTPWQWKLLHWRRQLQLRCPIVWRR